MTVGPVREAFQVGAADAGTTVKGQPDDTPYITSGNQYTDVGNCFYSDDINGFDNGFNFYISFTNPVNNLSLDLYDYSDDGNRNGNTNPICDGSNTACVGDVATLTVFADLDQTTEIGSGTYTVTENDVDGQRAFLTLDGSPDAPIMSASVTFSNADRGTGIDNIAFDAIPPLEICEPDTMDLIAGQHIDSGDVTVINDGTTLLITIQTQDGWQLSESHLQIGESLDDFPLTKKGNPKVGNFDYQRQYNPFVTEDTYEFLLADLDLEPGDNITFAVHTVVVQTNSDGEIIEEETAWKQGERFVQKGNWAMYNTYDVQDCDVIPSEEESVTLDLGPGWDRQGTLTDGSVVIENPSFPNWNVEFNLEGAAPNANFGHYGLDVFVDDCSTTPDFGDISPLTCGTFTRAGESGSETHTVIVYSFGAFSTDASGDANTSTAISGITAGSYDIEFWIGSSVNYQSDGNENGLFGFGDTKTFVIP